MSSLFLAVLKFELVEVPQVERHYDLYHMHVHAQEYFLIYTDKST